MSASGRSFKRTLVGRRMPMGSLEDELLPRWIALPIFASDPLSSVAYATEAALVVLMATSVASRELIIPISAIIALLLIVVVLSYRQTIFAYPNGGGSYVVAKENLGQLAGLVAAASLLIDYVLTAAVSIASGVLAVTSAVPELSSHAVELSLAVLVVLVLVNLRGVRESGFVFALPTYGFIIAVGATIVVGFVRGIFWGWPTAQVPDPAQVGLAGGVGVIILLRAFASGCSALTGVEAISNGVTAFRRPQARNAASTLLWMGVIAVVLFIGVSVLAYKVDARPSDSVSVLSEIARAVFPPGGSSFGYYAVQATTAAVLVLAANTAFQGFPRLAALLATDSFVPRQFSNLGDRLVYSNGILVLALAAGALIVGFHADVLSLIHLYLLGVFTAFTLSQLGMVRHNWGRRGAGESKGALIYKIGLNATGCAAHGTGRRHRDRDEVRRGRVDGRDRDPPARAGVRHRGPALRRCAHAPARSGRRLRRPARPGGALRQRARRCDCRGAALRARDRRRSLPRDPCRRSRRRQRHRPGLARIQR